jgi:hypothetical protein
MKRKKGFTGGDVVAIKKQMGEEVSRFYSY